MKKFKFTLSELGEKIADAYRKNLTLYIAFPFEFKSELGLISTIDPNLLRVAMHAYRHAPEGAIPHFTVGKNIEVELIAFDGDFNMDEPILVYGDFEDKLTTIAKFTKPFDVNERLSDGSLLIDHLIATQIEGCPLQPQVTLDMEAIHKLYVTSEDLKPVATTNMVVYKAMKELEKKYSSPSV